MTREQLIEIGRRIVSGGASEEELEKLFALFNANVPHPSGANPFFWPEKYNARRDQIADYQPTVEDVVDQCLAFKPIQL